MIKDKLSGIERSLVLQYLAEGNVPVTVTPVDENLDSSGGVHSLTSEILPVALKGEQVKANNSGVIFFENPPETVLNFTGKSVKVDFYFNKVGLYFVSPVQKSKDGVFVVVPEQIDRILDGEDKNHYDFSAVIYLDCNTQKELNLKCIPYDDIKLSVRPSWEFDSPEKQEEGRRLLKVFVDEAKAEKNAGKGTQLISICKYLIEAKEGPREAMEGRTKPFYILFINHERIVLGMESKYCNFSNNEEYGIKLFISLGDGPIATRDIFVTGVVNKIYRSPDNKFSCVDFRYSTIKEEDFRFLYEKSTSSVFM